MFEEQKQTNKQQNSTKQNYKTENRTGIPNTLKTQFEKSSGFSFNNVRVNYYSDKPVQLKALAYSQGHQESHLTHKLGHVIQQKTGEIRTPIIQFGRRKKHQRTKHDRKIKHDKKYEETDMYETEIKPPDFIMIDDEDSELDSEVEKPSETDFFNVAFLLFETLKKDNVNIFLSGGAALHFQGGNREMEDLDFRILKEEVGFTNFYEPKGKVFLAYINSRLKYIRQTVKKENQQINELFIIGDGKTIGTENFYNVPVSISLVTNKRDTIEKNKEKNCLNVLTVEEIFKDKLKTIITRNKSDMKSIKKISHDLYDLLNSSEILFFDKNPDLKSSLFYKNYSTFIINLIDKALDDRLEEYKSSNLDTTQLQEIVELKDLMKARLILTIQSYIKNGTRKNSMSQLITNADRKKYEFMTQRISSIPIKQEEKTRLRPWFQDFNTTHFKVQSTYTKHKKIKTKDDSSAETLSSLPYIQSFIKIVLNLTLINNGGVNLERIDEHILKVLTILYFSGGFRELNDSKNNLEVMYAFNLTANQFSDCFKLLKSKKIVEGKEDGLHFAERWSDNLINIVK